MTKYLKIILSVVLILGLAACSTTTDKGKIPTQPNKDQAITPKEGQSETRTIMQNTKVRTAIALALNKQKIIETQLGSGSKAIDYLVPSGIMSTTAGEDFRKAGTTGYLSYNPEQAKTLWAQAKEELKFETLEITLLTFDAQVATEIAQAFKEQIEATLVGLTVTIVAKPFDEKVKQAAAGEFDMEFTGWGPDYPDALTYLDIWAGESVYNTAGYKSEAYHDLLENANSAQVASDNDARIAALQSAEKHLLETDVVALPVYQRGGAVLQQPYVSGMLKHNFGPRYTFKNARTTLMTQGKKIIRLVTPEDLTTTDGTLANSDVSVTVLANINEGLVRIGENDQVMPGMASKWEKSEDGLTYKFHLREGALWSNGTPVTAQDFVFAWGRLAALSTQNTSNRMLATAKIKNYASVMSGELNSDQLGVKALDSATLQVTLEEPVPYFLKLITYPGFFPQSEAFVKLMGSQYGDSLETSLFNGPFVLESWDIGYGYHLAKNPTYWDAAGVAIHGVDYRLIKDAKVALSQYETGEIDSVSLVGVMMPDFKQHPQLKTYFDATVYYFVFNMR